MRSFFRWAHSLVYVVRGSQAFRKQDYDGMIACYSRAIEISPEDVDYYHQRAYAYWHKDEYGEAIADYTRAIALRVKTQKRLRRPEQRVN